jgi:hypothetical protein
VSLAGVTYPDGGQAVPQGGEAGEEDGALGPRRDGRQERLHSDAPSQLWTASSAGTEGVPGCPFQGHANDCTSP